MTLTLDLLLACQSLQATLMDTALSSVSRGLYL